MGQGQPASRPAGTAPASRGAATVPAATTRPIPKNLDRTLQDLITLDASKTKAGEFIDALRRITQTNIVVNWNALAAGGVTRDVPVTLHVRDVSYEAVVHALMEMLPARKAGGANFSVEDNILEITTNAELGKAPEFRLRDVDRALSYSFAAAVSPQEKELNGTVLEKVLAAEMARAGEPADARHALSIKEGSLAASVSDRGLSVLDRAIADFNQPVKLGQVAGGTQLTAPAKRAAEALKTAGVTPADYPAIARNPDAFKGKISFALLPGTADELAKASPLIDGAITDGGILLVGPREAILGRTLFAVYDLRDVIKRIAARNKLTPAPTPAEVQSAVVQILQTTLKPGPGAAWANADELARNPRASALIPAYGGILAVFATPETHRAIAGALQDMAK
jgi:hypothetical protein